MNKTTTMHAADKPVPYISNPFISSFNGLDQLFKLNRKPAIILLVLSLIGTIFQFIPNGGRHPATSTTSATNSSDPALGIILLVVMPLVSFLVLAIIVFFTGIVHYVAWRTSKNESTSFSEALQVCRQKFWTLTGALVLAILKIWGGCLLFIVPGVRAALRYQMVLFPVFDENLGARDAHKRIKELTRGHLIELFGILTVANLIFPITTLLMMGGQSVMYPQLKALHASGQPGPKAHWLNYLGFVLFAMFLLLMIMIGASILWLVSQSRAR